MAYVMNWSPLLNELQWPALVALAAHLLYVQLLLNLRDARIKHKIWPPATSGHPDFDRVFRVQANYVEQYPSFMTGMLLTAIFINGLVAGALGLVWVVFRFLHSRKYAAARLTFAIYWYTFPQYVAVGLMFILPALRVVTHAVLGR
eukprot:jgi/Mesen1/10098/ME000074S09437